MSKGNPVIQVRVTPEELAAIDAACGRSMTHSRGEPLDRSAWVRRAIREALSKPERSRRAAARRRSLTRGQIPEDDPPPGTQGTYGQV